MQYVHYHEIQINFSDYIHKLLHIYQEWLKIKQKSQSYEDGKVFPSSKIADKR